MSYGLPHLNFRDLSSASALQARRDRERERRAPTTDQIIDARQKKHVEDAFISSQLVELGLLNPKHAVGKGAGRAFKSESREEIVKGTGKAEAYPKKS